MSELTKEQAILDKHLIDLHEHFDSVIIIATKASDNDEKKTQHHFRGRGNWYAQYGSVMAWLQFQESINDKYAKEDCD